jgi:hypothetical protein
VTSCRESRRTGPLTALSQQATRIDTNSTTWRACRASLGQEPAYDILSRPASVLQWKVKLKKDDTRTKNKHRQTKRPQEKRERDRERERKRQRETERGRGREREREKETETERDGEREKEKEKGRGRGRESGERREREGLHLDYTSSWHMESLSMGGRMHRVHMERPWATPGHPDITAGHRIDLKTISRKEDQACFVFS